MASADRARRRARRATLRHWQCFYSSNELRRRAPRERSVRSTDRAIGAEALLHAEHG
jgi:hypothetical protein